MTARILDIASDAEKDVLSAASSAIAAGSLVVIPTETVYGVAGKDEESVIEKIYAAKSRDRKKPLPLMCASFAEVKEQGFMLNRKENILAEHFWPGPLTMILERNGKSEGVRVPQHELVCHILAACGGLLRVTSANCSGQPPALDAQMALDSLGDRVALVVDGGRVRDGVPSTVVKCHDAGFDILREGAISHASICDALGDLL